VAARSNGCSNRRAGDHRDLSVSLTGHRRPHYVANALAVTSIGALPVWMLSAYAPNLQRDLGIDTTSLGLILAGYFGLSSVIAMRGGRFVERVGWRRAVVVTSVVSAISLVAIALLARSVPTLVLGMLIGALANSTSQPAGNDAIAAGVDRNRQGLAFGVKQAALPISTLIVGMSVGLFDRQWGWRAAFLCGAALALCLAVTAGLRVLRESAELRRSAAAKPARSKVRHQVTRPLKLLSVGAGFGTAATISLGGFLPIYAVQRGLDAGSAGQLLALGSAIGVVSRVVSGVLADRRTGRHLIVVASMMGCGCLGLLVLALFGDAPAGLILGTALAFGLGWSWNGVFHLAVVRYATVPPPVATSAAQTAMNLGAAVGPAGFGALAVVSYTLAWSVSALCLGVAAVLMICARRTL
jgi:predicted MFS family arabinose efflux permease